MADCFYHPGRDAVGACVACGKMICFECRTMLGGKIYCQPCGDELFTKKGAEAAKPAGPQRVSGAWWLLPIFFVFIGGLIAWGMTRDRDPQRARGMLWWGVGLTFLYALIGAFITLVIEVINFGGIIGFGCNGF